VWVPARRVRFAMVMEEVERLIPYDRPLRVLDAGAGDGVLATALARRHPHWHVVAADVNDEMMLRGRSRAARLDLDNVEFVRADITNDLGSQEFDLALAIECLVEIADDDAALRALTRSLKPGGHLILHVPDQSWAPVLRGSPRHWRYEVRHGYGPEQLLAKLARVGLVEARLRPTARSSVFLGQEVADRIKNASLSVRVAAMPVTEATAQLERWGVTWGPSRALLGVARRGDVAAAARS
jgi:SAM-dependent methyltransferase